MDWKRFMALQPDELTDTDKDELFSTVVWFDLDEAKINWDKMKHLFKITQEILKYKNEQVESLISELDELATRQGEEEAQSIRRIGRRVIGRESDDEYDNFKEEYLGIKAKMKEQSAEIQRYSKEIEKLTRQVNFLEREKSDLQAQLQSHQSAVESDNDSSETVHESHRELVDNIHQKNRHISELLTDVELLEKDNIILRENLMNLREELTSTTNKMANIAGDLNDLRHLYEAQKDRNSALEEKNSTLSAHLDELSTQRRQHNEEIEKLSAVLDEKIDEWKRILETKDEEIEEWKSRYNGALLCQTKTVETGADNETVEALTRTIERQEDKIEELEQQLRGATVEMNETAALIEKMKSESEKRITTGVDESDVVAQLKVQVQAANERVQVLQNRVADAEDDACHKAEEVSTLIRQLREYEDGHYGLSEAIVNIQELKSKVRTRDKQIQELVRLSNKLQSDADKLEMENLSLMNSLGLPIESTVRTDGIATKLKSYKKSIQKLQMQIENFEEEKIRLTLENRQLGRSVSKLTSQINVLGATPDVLDDEADTGQVQQVAKRDGVDDELQRKYVETERHLDDVITENEALRKGMHEILDSIQEQAAKSELTIKSDILERLLKALDIRHVSGWYHPAMRLQAEVFSLQGGNSELRDQLQAIKSEAEQKIEKLQKEKLEAEFGQRRASKSKQADVGVIESAMLPVELSPSSAEIIYKQNCHLLHVLNEYHSQEEKNKELSTNLEAYRKNLNTIRHQLGLLYKEYNDEKRKWTSEKKAHECERTELNDRIDTLTSQLDEMRKNLVNDEPNNNNKDDANDQKQVLDDSRQRLLDLIADHTVLRRKYTYLEKEETRFSSHEFKMKQELLDFELYAKRTIAKLEQEREQLIIKTHLLEKTLGESVHGSKYDSIVRENTEISRKYREMLEQQNCVKDGFRNQTEFLELKVRDYVASIEKLKKELLDAKTELYSLKENSGKDTKTDGNLSERFAELEIKTISETQRANHSDNLMKVIQDQLKRSEERFADVLSQNNSLQIKIVELQRRESDLQDRLVDSIDKEIHETSKRRTVELEAENEKWKAKYFGLQDTYRVSKEELRFYKLQKFFCDDETVGLKHQLLDLQAISDEKALIARLEADVFSAKNRQTETDRQVENLKEDIARLNEALDAKNVDFQRRDEESNNRISQLNTKCRNLENILHSQRRRYAGSAPLLTVEHVYENLKQASIDAQAAYKKLLNIEKTENDMKGVNEELLLKIQLIDSLKSVFEERNGKSASERLLQWHQERNELKINELKYCRQIEFKDNQLQHAFVRLNKQEDTIQNLQKEMLGSVSVLDEGRSLNTIVDSVDVKASPKKSSVTPSTIKEIAPSPSLDKRSICAETQTVIEYQHQFTVTSFDDFDTDDLDNELKRTLELLSEKTANLKNCESRVNELERMVHDLRKDLALTQEELLTSKKPAEPLPTERTNGTDQNDQISSMKAVIIDLQKIINQKEETVVMYQNMLKERRDEHGKAAELFQSEIQQLQAALLDQKQENEQLKNRETKESSDSSFQNRDALEKYVEEVHVLESHVGELHTAVHSLESQLGASQQEALRWKSLSEDRLSSMDKLRVQLETQHQTELDCYKNECAKWRDECEKTKQELSKLRIELNQGGVNVAKIINDKDNLIHELQVQLNEFKEELRRHTDKPPVQVTPQMIVLEGAKKKLQADNESLKKQLNALTNKEKSARDEIQSLKAQLLRRPILSARSDRSNERLNLREQQLQKKITTLEMEISDVKQKLEKETAINEMRRARNADELALWDKQKRWQQTAEKLREKLKTKTGECERLEQSVGSLKGVVSRIEREKHVLESKLKVLRGSQVSVADNRIEMLELENVRLTIEVEALTKKLEMQQHHSGGLGAAMMEEKLESQERKIAVLELASKGNSTLLAELERLQTANGALQKENLRLQAASLEMKLELEKSSNDTPRLREQIGHLEKYVEVLKAENMQHMSSAETNLQSSSNKKITELEKTVFVLKRIIEKQHVELKRIHSPKATTSGQTMSTEKLKSELYKSQQKLKDSSKRIAHLEDELQKAQKHIKLLENGTIPERPDSGGNMAEEIADLRAQLKQKSDLLDKVKMLLHKAAVKEKALDEQIKMLKSLVPQESSSEPTSKSQ